MIYLFTGLPGASKTLNTIIHLVSTNDGTRPNFYNNIRNFVLDYDFIDSFSGWFYAWYYPRLEDENVRKRISKIMLRCHEEDRNVELKDVPFLHPFYETADSFQIFDYWVRRLYKKEQLADYFNLYELTKDDLKFDTFKHLNLHFTYFKDPHSWYELPKKSRILIDEAQHFFPPRSASKSKPQAISELETHRHKGYDIYFITQNSSFLDINIRRLTGSHTHFYNALGGKRLTKKTSPKHFDEDDYFATKDLDKKIIKRDTTFYGSYYSAEIHTHKFKAPKWLFYLFGCFLILAVSLFFIIKVFTGFGDDNQKIKNTASLISSETKHLSKEYIDFENKLNSIYINGHVRMKRGKNLFNYYTFEDVEKRVSFYPENMGFTIHPLSSCSVKIVFNTYSKIIFCNPYGQKPIELSSTDSSQDRKKVQLF